MFRRVLVSSLLAAAMGLGCGGVEAPESTGNEAPAPEDKTALVTSCEQIWYRGCSPNAETTCVFNNGMQGWCYCQDIPFNQWQCTTEW